MATIPLHRRDGTVRDVALIDDADLALTDPHRWYVVGGKYVGTTIAGRLAYLHRFLLAAPAGVEVDHVNRDPLDNRRANLRLATHADNGQNVTPQRDATSRYRGVHWHRQRGYWVASAKANGRRVHLGIFDDEAEAAQAAAAFRAANMPYATG